MKHGVRTRKFGLKKGARRSFLRVLANNLITREKIVTTEAKAKELRKIVEPFVTCGKQQTVAALRLLMRRLPKSAAYKMYHDIAPRYKERHGGYTRVIKHSKPRVHDGSRMATIEFV